jgi:hypothetical protein
MSLSIPECDPRAECECGWSCYGDSMNDAAIGWTAHVATAHRDDDWT